MTTLRAAQFVYDNMLPDEYWMTEADWEAEQAVQEALDETRGRIELGDDDE